MNGKNEIAFEINAFLIDRRSRELSHHTISWYERNLRAIARPWFEDHGIITMDEITPTSIREFLLDRGKYCKSSGGVRASFMTLRSFLNWYTDEHEYDLQNWHNPIAKIKKPKQNTDPKPGYDLEVVNALVATCASTSEMDLRDKAIFLTFIDSGLRMEELEYLTVGDVNLNTGLVRVRHGKGDKGRDAFIKPLVIRELIRYLRSRGRLDDDAPLFASTKGKRGFLKRNGLRHVLDYRANKAGVKVNGFHSFRRGFTIEMLRSGADILSISRLLGHTSERLVGLYAKQNSDDLKKVHDKYAPSDKL